MSDYYEEYLYSNREEKLAILMDCAKDATPEELVIIQNAVKKVLLLPRAKENGVI